MRISDWSSDVCSSDLAEAALGTQARHLAAETFDEKGLRVAGAVSRRQIECEPGRVGNADFLADQVVDRGAQRERLAGAFYLCADRQHHLAAIPEGFQAAQRKAVRHRPGDLRLLQVLGAAPVHPRRPTRSEEHTSELQSLM